jgi:hypothetical protein
MTRLLLPAAWWGRMRVEVPERGSLLVAPNHNSQWDPVVVGVALRRRRVLRFLAPVEDSRARPRPRRDRADTDRAWRRIEPAGAQAREGEDPAALATRLLEELRARVPPNAAGRQAS